MLSSVRSLLRPFECGCIICENVGPPGSMVPSLRELNAASNSEEG